MGQRQHTNTNTNSHTHTYLEMNNRWAWQDLEDCEAVKKASRERSGTLANKFEAKIYMYMEQADEMEMDLALMCCPQING